MATVRTKLLRHSGPNLAFAGSKIRAGETAATLGNFDGIHLGHQALIEKLAARKNASPEINTLLISFYPHPAVVLKKAPAIPRITSAAQMTGILSDMGVDYLYLVHFTPSFSKHSAEEFVGDFLIRHLNVGSLIIGEDARVGAGGRGDSEFIRKILQADGREVEVVAPVLQNGERISSRRVRTAVLSGDMVRAAGLLGRDFSLAGRITAGEGRGKNLGFPTANLALNSKMLLPANGVYAARVRLGRKEYKAVTNVGVRPTFGALSVSVESHLLDYQDSDFYGSKVELYFVKKIRDEVKFPDVEALKSQISRDLLAGRSILEES